MSRSLGTNLFENDGIMGNEDLDLVGVDFGDKSDENFYGSQQTSLISSERNNLVPPISYSRKNLTLKGSWSMDSRTYRTMDLKYRFYRICNNMMIKNPDRIYNMFIKRLNKRKRLESSGKNLEIVVAALFYIDQRKNTPNIYTLKDVLSKIPESKINLKQFTKFVSKISMELGIKKFPVSDDQLIISNLMEQLRGYLLENIEVEEDEILKPKSTTRVILGLNELFNLDRLMGVTAEGDPESVTEEASPPNEESQKKIKIDGNHYKKIYKLLSQNYEKIERLTLRILKYVENPGLSEEEVLDPKTRLSLYCRKTLISCALFMSVCASKIPVNCVLMIRALKVSTSTFYRNLNKLVSKLKAALTNQYKCEINSMDNLLSLILLPMEPNSTRESDPGLPKTLNKISKVSFKGELKSLTPKILKVDRVLKGIKREKGKTVSFSEIATCLDFLGKTQEPEKEVDLSPSRSAHSIYFEDGANRYVCRYKFDGKIKRKTFSANHYGKQNAYKLAVYFLEKVGQSCQ